MTPVTYDLKRAIADFGVPWKPEIGRWLTAAPVYVTALKDNEALWGVSKKGVILPHDSLLIECAFPSTCIWSHLTVFAKQSDGRLLAYPFLRERASSRWTTTEVECAYDRATGVCHWTPNPAIKRGPNEIRLLVESVVALIFAVADALDQADVPERAAAVSLSKRQRFARPGVSGWVYRLLDIAPALSRQHSRSDGTHASPRWHIRRGHWRRLPTGRRTFVRECEVGDPARGGIVKDYRVQVAARA